MPLGCRTGEAPAGRQRHETTPVGIVEMVRLVDPTGDRQRSDRTFCSASWPEQECLKNWPACCGRTRGRRRLAAIRVVPVARLAHELYHYSERPWSPVCPPVALHMWRSLAH